MIYAAERIPEIADNVVEIDNAMRWGFNWPRGPFEVADGYGLKKCVAGIKATGNEKLLPNQDKIYRYLYFDEMGEFTLHYTGAHF